MNRYLWDAQSGAFYDYDWVAGARRDVLSAATLYPLFVGEADDTQAHAVADAVRAKLLRPGGLATTENHTGQQWDEPNGWAPLQWIAVEGLQHYGLSDPADDIATHWLATVQHAYDATGRLVEKYDVDDPDAQRRRRRIQAAGRLRLDQRRYDRAAASLSPERSSKTLRGCEVAPIRQGTNRESSSAVGAVFVCATGALRPLRKAINCGDVSTSF